VSRDFVRKTNRARNKGNHKTFVKENINSPLKWLLAGLILGIAIAVLVYLQLVGDKIPKINSGAGQVEKINKSSNKKKFPAVKVPTETEYEFWDLLKNKQVEVQQDRKILTTKTKNPRKYIMQCGSFKNVAMAQALKAKIALVGFSSNIHKTQEKDGFVWHRVVIGPYSSKRKAESDRHQLNGNGIGGCQIW